MTIYELLIEPATHDFMQRAIFAAMLVGVVNGIIGCFVVVRGMAFFGDALAHSILPGVAAAYVMAGPGADVALFLGALFAGVFSALGVGWLTRKEQLKEDTALGIVFVAMFALGIAMISDYGSDLIHILFGHILGISNTDLLIMTGCTIGIIVVVLLLYKELLLINFDAQWARALRLPAEALRLLLLVLIAVTIVTSLQIVGITLMLAMLVTPAATARLFTHRMHHMMIAAASIGVAGGVVGIYFAYHLDIDPGPAIVLTITTIFILVLASARLRDRSAIK